MNLSEIIRNARNASAMSQEDLANGICAVETLSRIERAHQVPHYRTYKALMIRMGMTSMATRDVYDHAKQTF